MDYDYQDDWRDGGWIRFTIRLAGANGPRKSYILSEDWKLLNSRLRPKDLDSSTGFFPHKDMQFVENVLSGLVDYSTYCRPPTPAKGVFRDAISAVCSYRPAYDSSSKRMFLVVSNVENGASVALASYKVESLKGDLSTRFKVEKLIVSEEQTQFEFEAPLPNQEAIELFCFYFKKSSQ